MNARVELAAERLLGALQSRQELRGAKVTECISAKDSRAVFAGRFKGRSVVFKHFSGEDAHEQTAALEAEMTYQWARMSTGACRVPEPLWFAPELGLAIMAQVSAERLDLLISGETRAQFISHSAEWLREYSRDRQRKAEFSPRFWVRQNRRLIPQHEAPEDRERARRLVKWMLSRVGALNGREILQTRSHGDFFTANLLYADGVMYGVDLHNQTWLPVAKDVARYLVHLSITHPVATDHRICGLPSEDVRGFLAAFGMLDEQDPLLAFFVASELAGRLAMESIDEAHHASKQGLVDGFLEGKGI